MQIRQALSISADANAVFERHSDSAAAYVRLEPDNTAVWKQLYRAAKAKRKLKLRVILHDSEEEDEQDEEEQDESSGPKPVTVEDVPEQQGQDMETKPERIVSIPASPIDSFHLKTTDPMPQTDKNQPLEKAMSNLQLGFEKHEQERDQSCIESTCVAPKTSNFAVCCNHCERTVPDAHYHCSTCDNGDFDLCPACVEGGVTCYNSDHWLLKRFVRGDVIMVSTTERVSPKPKVKKEEPDEKQWHAAGVPEARKITTSSAVYTLPVHAPVGRSFSIDPMRTCNSCVQELPDKEFLHCLSCDDFDLCKACFTSDQHGHHPKHAFAAAVEGTPMATEILRRLSPGRDQRHHAICDGCDKFIFGIRHKCLDCPDWDYCPDCVVNAGFVHPNHRFVPIYEQIPDVRVRTAARSSHWGICCDGPLCSGSRRAYITGDRFKCAVCHDTDFCANCEASPANTHNKTHPLIKFKTPVRRVEVKTKGEDENGQKMPVMGDRLRPKAVSPGRTDVNPEANATSVVDAGSKPDAPAVIKSTKATHASLHCPQAGGTLSQSPSANLAKSVELSQTAAALATRRKLLEFEAQQARQPTDIAFEAQQRAQAQYAAQHRAQAQHAIEFEAQQRQVEAQRQVIASNMAVKALPVAIFVRDTVPDGTVMRPNHVFEQTWFLRNGGDTPWPAGCSVKFIGGDYMGHIDSSHPAGIHDLVSASESTVCYDALAPGQEFPFTVLLRTPAREGKVISYWRLQSEDGLKFGHRLWCDVSVQKPKTVEAPAPEVVESPEKATDPERLEKSAESSQMIFPKIDTNTSVTNIAEDSEDFVTASPTHSDNDSIDDYELCGDDEAWAEDSDEGLLTDEEYDILDASDEEYMDEQKKTQK